MSKKLSEYRNEEAAAVLADIIEPASEIMSDEKFREALKDSKISAAKIALKEHGKAIIDVLAIYDGAEREKYSINPIGIVSKVIAILNDKDLMSAFTLQEQTAES